MTPSAGPALFGPKFRVESSISRARRWWRVPRSYFLRAAALARVRDLRVARSEELLLLEFDPLPRRVADHAGEAAGPASGWVDAGGAVADAEDVRELDVPVEEPVLAGQSVTRSSAAPRLAWRCPRRIAPGPPG